MNQKQLKKDIDSIARIDADVETALQIIGYPEPRIRPEGLETLLSTIIGQQISTEAAAAVMGRVRELLPRMQASELQMLSPERLRAAGLSGRKVEYAFGLADAIVDGSLDTGALNSMDDEQAIRTITAIRGFGDWSAEIYLMFSLQRSDIFPAKDLALQIALQRLKGLKQRPSDRQARSLIEHWSPWRSAGSLFLWHYYRGAPT
ncbi:MAG: DNA-3-methyladenine glycosylase 2 family protein [Gammaproteobacteria bacterium]|nr:DNA-3-methyladenine glycosylase 2 family protein [Gammaproteobacteria bacterium]